MGESNGSPDWEYMQKYMESLKQDASGIIDMLSKV